MLHSLIAVTLMANATFAQFSWLWSHPAVLNDISFDAVMGDRTQFDAWAGPFRAMMAAKVAAVGIGPAGGNIIGPTQVKPTYQLRAYGVQFPSGPTINVFVAVPDVIDPDKPLIVALSGHEVPVGEAPNPIFDPGGWGDKWASAGYIVYAPANAFYSQLGIFSNGTAGWNDYHAVWVRMQQRLWEYLTTHSLIPETYSGRVITGLSAGCETGAWWSAIEPELFDIAVFAGHMIDLDWLRESQRALGNPPTVRSWSINGVLSFTSLFALVSPDPLMMQLGRTDNFFPRLTRIPATTSSPGEPRPPITDDVLALHFSLKQIWETAGSAYQLDLHNGGHEYDFPAALSFIQAH